MAEHGSPLLGAILASSLAQGVARAELRENPAFEGDVPGRTRRLAALRDELERGVAFTPGDMVTWKEGLRNTRYPAAGEPAVIMEVSQPFVDESITSGSPYFRQPMNVAVGTICEEGHFEIFWLDGRRLKKIEA